MMQRIFRRVGLWVWLLTLSSVVLISGQPAQPVRAQDDVTWLLNQVNSLRAGLGLPAYTLNGQLSAAAQQQAQYLTDTCNVAHVWPDGTTPAARAAAAGYTGSHVIENIYAGTNATAESAWNFFITSPVHYSGLVNTIVNEIGIGVAHGGLCSHAYTMVFGRSGDGSAPPVQPASQGGSVAAVVPPAPAVYVPPPPSSTPTATIPTLTPSATWTLTPTATPSATFTPITPTGTAIELSAQNRTAVALVASSTPAEEIAPTDSPSPVRVTLAETPSATPSMTPTPILPTATPIPAARSASPPPDDSGLSVRDLLPFALVGQMVLIGIAGFAYFRKSR
jgi:hypothetical protein